MGPWCGQMGALGWVGLVAVVGLVVALVVWVVGRLFPVAAVQAPAPGDDRLAARDVDPRPERAAAGAPERVDRRSGSASR